jgi:hypothetical protein
MWRRKYLVMMMIVDDDGNGTNPVFLKDVHDYGWLVQYRSTWYVNVLVNIYMSYALLMSHPIPSQNPEKDTDGERNRKTPPL